MSWSKAKIPVFETAKWLSLILVIVFIISLMSQGRQSTTAFSDMTQSILNAADLSTMQEADSQMVKRLYGLDPSNYAGILCYTPTTNMGAEEILVVKLTDVSQQDAVKSAIDARIQTQMDSFEGYAIEQYEMLQNAVVELQGNYVLLVVAKDTAPVRQAFLDTL